MRRDFETLRMARVGAHEGADAKFGARCVAMEHAKAFDGAGSVFDFVCGASRLDAGPQGGQKIEPFRGGTSKHSEWLVWAPMGVRTQSLARDAKACGSAGSVFDFACGASGLDAGP